MPKPRATTDRDTYVVQGWKVAGESPDLVEIPSSLLAYLPPEFRLATHLNATGRLWRGDDGECGTYILSGSPLTDPEALAQMRIPGHESCVEVGKLRKDG